MPRFLDYHEKAPPMPAETVKMVQQAIKAGKADPFGVKMLNGFAGAGHAWCLTDAPNADAVCKSHAAMGITQTKGNVTEVMTYA